MQRQRVLTVLGTVVLGTVALATALLSAGGGEAAPPDFEPGVAGVPPSRAVLVGDAFDLSSAATTQRQSPSVAYNSTDNQYTVVWFDTRNPGNNDIFGQRVSATGALLGPNFPLIQFADSQSDPVVAYNSADNRYLVVWQTQQSGFFNQARGRRVASDGTHLGADFFVNSGGFELSAAYNTAANEWLVTGRAFPGSGIRGRRVRSDGSLAGSEIVISSGGGPNGQVAYNPSANEYLATWGDYTAGNLQAQRISGGGTLLGTPIVISPVYPSGGYAASVAFDPVGSRYLVAFRAPGQPDLLGQFVSGTGGLLGANFAIAVGLAYPRPPLAAYSLADQAFFVVSRDGGNIVGRLLSASGGAMGAPVPIAGGTASGEPALAYNSWTGQFLVAWPDSRNASLSGEDIYARLLDLVPAAPGDANCDGRVDAVDAAMVLQYSAGLIVWQTCLGVAEVSIDGSLNALDAVLILQYVAGLIPGLPAP